MDVRMTLQSAGALAVVGWLAFTQWGPRQTHGGKAPPAKLAPGAQIEVAITVVSTDAVALSCASDAQLGDRRCGFDAHGRAREASTDAARAVLAPYKTTDDQLLLVPGLFAQPALQQRLAIDPPVFGGEHARFVAHCQFTVEGDMTDVQVRWEPPPRGVWRREPRATVGTVTSCVLSDG